MRVMIPLLLSAFFAVAASAQPSSSNSNMDPGKMPLAPNNCGTPYEPKPCGGKAMTNASMKPAHPHKAMTHTKTM